MSDLNIFEQASRQQLRFETARGLLTTEQLWAMPLTGTVSLDTLAVSLDKAIREMPARSFVVSSTPANKVLELQFSIVKHIIDVRVCENTEKTNRQVKAQQRKMVQEQIAVKENEALLSGSVEELRKRLAELTD